MLSIFTLWLDPGSGNGQFKYLLLILSEICNLWLVSILSGLYYREFSKVKLWWHATEIATLKRLQLFSLIAQSRHLYVFHVFELHDWTNIKRKKYPSKAWINTNTMPVQRQGPAEAFVTSDTSAWCHKTLWCTLSDVLVKDDNLSSS